MEKECKIPKSALPCKKCKVLPVWGACFLVCSNCNAESDYSVPAGNAVRTWNKAQNTRRKS